MEQIVSLYVCNMLSIVGWNVWSESNGRHLINPPGEKESIIFTAATEAITGPMFFHLASVLQPISKCCD